MQFLLALHTTIIYTKSMEKPQRLGMPQYLKDKQQELMFALADKNQGFRPADIQQIFNFKHLSTVTRILEKKPIDWKPKWVKKI